MKKSIKISLIVTVLNEADTIDLLLESIVKQTWPPDEVIFVDAGSIDQTLQLIKSFAQSHSALHIRSFVQQGNRSQGRNKAITEAKYDWIAITDAGCILHQNWLEQLAQSAEKSHAQVIAGYYDARPSNQFQAAVVPYVLVMPDRVDPKAFLPATRSMLIHKHIWQKVGGFPEELTVSEDFAFAQEIREQNIVIHFTDKAKVTWLPRKNLLEFFTMVTSMAEGDAQASVTRLKAKLVLVRYAALGFITWLGWWQLMTLLGVAYIAWSIQKNLRYAPAAWYWLPILQLTADFGVMWGTVKGWISRHGFTK